MQPEAAEVKRWLIKGRHDWSVAKGIVAAGGEETEIAAFHCQQAVEKRVVQQVWSFLNRRLPADTLP